MSLTFRAEGGPWFGEPGTEVLDHHLRLEMDRGVLSRRSRLRDADGRVVVVTQRRFVSMRDPHLAGLETTLVAENWSGRLEVRSGVDGRVRNDGVARYAELSSQHLVPLCGDQSSDEVVCLQMETSQSHIRLALAARTRVFMGGLLLRVEPRAVIEPGFVALDLAVDVREGHEVVVEKVAALFTSRDAGISEPGEEACDWADERGRDVRGAARAARGELAPASGVGSGSSSAPTAV